MSTHNLPEAVVRTMDEANAAIRAAVEAAQREAQERVDARQRRLEDAAIAFRATTQVVADGNARDAEELQQLNGILGVTTEPTPEVDEDDGDTDDGEDEGDTPPTEPVDTTEPSPTRRRYWVANTLWGALVALLVGLMLILALTQWVIPWDGEDLFWYVDDVVKTVAAAMLVGFGSFVAGWFVDMIVRAVVNALNERAAGNG